MSYKNERKMVALIWENKYVNKFFQKKTEGVLIFLKKNRKPYLRKIKIKLTL
ncbi:hypothetical protein GCM10007424_13460 [Flavobacterium suaedae]|uniref:Uncharacterized protein n=1 Tax=Flavobacterium suaedae TaxID=1767027 RepID=A0ABQ1JR99_9FLAO|nr:hypothetical protein GCM10007424_13460 [Flavobacterium suaedae]